MKIKSACLDSLNAIANFSWWAAKLQWNRKILRLLQHQKGCLQPQVPTSVNLCCLSFQKLGCALLQKMLGCTSVGLAPEPPEHRHAPKWVPAWAVTSPCDLQVGRSYHHYADTPQKHCSSAVVFKTLSGGRGRKQHICVKKQKLFLSVTETARSAWVEGEWWATLDQVTASVYTSQEVHRRHWIYLFGTHNKRMGTQVLILQIPAGMWAWITVLPPLFFSMFNFDFSTLLLLAM